MISCGEVRKGRNPQLGHVNAPPPGDPFYPASDLKIKVARQKSVATSRRYFTKVSFAERTTPAQLRWAK